MIQIFLLFFWVVGGLWRVSKETALLQTLVVCQLVRLANVLFCASAIYFFILSLFIKLSDMSCLFTLGGNGPGIATVADLRASSLSAETKAHAEQRPRNYHQAPLLWLYHVELNPAIAG